MLERLKNLLRPAEIKTSRTARLIALESPGRPRWTPRDYAALAREGFIANAVVHRAVKLVAELSLIECPGFALTLLHALWNGHQAGITGFADLSALLMAYFAARFGVLGVYVSGRSREKQCFATGQPVPGLVARAVGAGR